MAPNDDSGTWGCVIGRFQPFHADHLSLVEAVVATRGRVIVAVTNAEPSWRIPVEEAPHRHRVDANPFTYWQRAEMIHAALSPLIPVARYRVTPFPIHDPARWDAYLPESVECWVRERGPWEQRKIKELEPRYRVRKLPAVAGEVCGTTIRSQITDNDPAWRAAVPQSVASLVEAWLRYGSPSA